MLLDCRLAILLSHSKVKTYVILAFPLAFPADPFSFFDAYDLCYAGSIFVVSMRKAYMCSRLVLTTSVCTSYLCVRLCLPPSVHPWIRMTYEAFALASAVEQVLLKELG